MQIDNESGALEEEKGVWGSQGGEKDKYIYILYCFVPVTGDFFFLKL